MSTAERGYTPGPWIVVLGWDGGKAVHVRARPSEHWPNGGETVVALPCRRNGAKRGCRVTYDPPSDELLANAQLIAAAPRMLEACESASQRLALIISELRRGQTGNAIRYAASLQADVDAAISKATTTEAPQ
jgi:hypothetical protein